jgi:quercetin dioxygenase-like cupin family protein
VSAFDELSSLEPQQIWDGIIGRSVHGERITLGVIELAANAIVPEHSHENEQLGIVVRGSVGFRVGDESRGLGPGGTWRIPANVPHEVTVGPEGAVVIDVFAPVRSDWQALDRLEQRRPVWPD